MNYIELQNTQNSFEIEINSLNRKRKEITHDLLTEIESLQDVVLSSFKRFVKDMNQYCNREVRKRYILKCRKYLTK